ncbi:MAG: hypothetical protein ABFC62_04690 [Clostridiaceae bacterium]|nr:hypothetical protein [Eubacteriales bacterium]
MKKSFALLMALLVLFTVGCSKPDDGDTVTIGNSTPTPAQSSDNGVSLTLSQPVGSGMVAAGSVHSLGARTDGTVIAAGHNTAGQNVVATWANVVAIAAYGELSAAVTADGKVLLAGKNADAMSDALAWTDICAVAVGEGFILGLKADGTVAFAGDNAAGQGDVSGWSGIVQIAAAGSHSLGLKNDGTVVAAGDNAANQGNVSGWSNVVKIAAGKDVSVAVTSEGKALSTKDDLSAWADVKDIAAGDAITAAVTGAGAVLCMPENADASAISGAAAVAAGAEHIIVMKADGAVAGLGSDSDFQLSVTGWQLRPYMEDTYLLGFAPGATAARVKAILAAQTGSANIALKANGADMTDNDAVFTGVEVLKDGAAYGTLVILGDVNGDSIINAADAESISKFLSDSTTLEGAFACAAGIVKDADGKVSSSATTEALNNYNTGAAPLVQFRSAAAASLYAAKIAEYKTKNDDVVGWIQIEGTNIDYPIMFDDDPSDDSKPKGAWFYNYHTWDKKESDSGSVYAYYSQFAQNNAITAHNARVSGTMFHQLHHIQEYNLGSAKCAGRNCKDPVNQLTDVLPDLKTYKGRIFTVSIYGVEAKWEVFAMYEAPKGEPEDTLYYNIWFPGKNHWKSTPEEIQEWINKQISRSEVDLGVTPLPSETFLTIVTCGNEHEDSDANGRLYFFLHRVG